jgi:hypothetical protein
MMEVHAFNMVRDGQLFTSKLSNPIANLGMFYGPQIFISVKF